MLDESVWCPTRFRYSRRNDKEKFKADRRLESVGGRIAADWV